jgi:exodeoxyribonuclease VII large subunit
MSAIGHEIDVTLSDLVADVHALTPSEAAERVAPAADEINAVLRRHQQRLLIALRSRATSSRMRLDALAGSRVFRRPLERVQLLGRGLDELSRRLSRATNRIAEVARGKVEARAAQLESLSPLAVLGRGYSVTIRESNGRVVRDAAELVPGEAIITRLGRGEAASRVERVTDYEQMGTPAAQQSLVR